MKKLSDYIIISDVDGTLLPADQNIPERNLQAIKRFTAAGGRFGIATGRSKELTEDFVRLLPVNAPCVLYNGGGLYDFTTQKFLMQEFLPENAKAHLQSIRKTLPHIAVLVITGGNYFHVTWEIPFTAFSKNHLQKFPSAAPEQLTGPWYKVLFAVNPADIKAFFQCVNGQSFTGIRFVQTNTTLIEMLPEKSTKGYALQKLVELGYIEQENVAAIGDYYNDLEMLQFAGIGAATQAAPEDVKVAADIVVGSCEHGAVADLVEYLERITR